MVYLLKLSLLKEKKVHRDNQGSNFLSTETMQEPHSYLEEKDNPSIFQKNHSLSRTAPSTLVLIETRVI